MCNFLRTLNMFHQYSLNPIFLEKLFRSSVLMIFLLLPVLSYCQQYDPCNDSLYISLISKSLDDMSEREYEYFLQKDKECHQHSKSTTTSKKSSSGYSRTSSVRRISPYKGGMRVGVDVSGKFIMSIEEVEIDDDPDMGITYG